MKVKLLKNLKSSRNAKKMKIQGILSKSKKVVEFSTRETKKIIGIKVQQQNRNKRWKSLKLQLISFSIIWKVEVVYEAESHFSFRTVAALKKYCTSSTCAVLQRPKEATCDCARNGSPAFINGVPARKPRFLHIKRYFARKGNGKF